MSSMDVKSLLPKSLLPKSLLLRAASVSLLAPILAAATACHASDGSEWDRARAALIAGQRSSIAQAVDKWQALSASRSFGFSEYAGFLLAYPGFPEEEKLRRAAEAALDREGADPARLVAYFDRFPPLTNPARAQYALALRAMGRGESAALANQAWRGGAMSDSAETAIASTFGNSFTPADQDARMDALLWAGAQAQAERQLGLTSPSYRGIAAARLAVLAGSDPLATGIPVDMAALNADPGYIYARARQLRRQGQASAAAELLANRPRLSRKPLDREGWVTEMLANARAAVASGNARAAVRIAAKIDDAFDPGEDIARLSFPIRDNYTSLTWLGGSTALRELGSAADASGLFHRYGAAARTPGTRSKGFYWAGRALAQAGRSTEAQAEFATAARYADQFYGQLSLERLAQPIPPFPPESVAQPTPEDRARFASQPLTQAVKEVARDADWLTALKFFKEVSEQQQTPGQFNMVADLAKQIGRRDLGVVVGQTAEAKGFTDFQRIAFPLIPVPAGHEASWTMVHAITRQESQFANNAVSHAGARGLMQLMPGTAAQEARKLGMSYSSSSLTDDSRYNLTLGSTYVGRLMDYYGGSYPLAVAAFNAGAGNVNKWLRANGDPRTGEIDWIEWIERIPFTETRGYVQHVLENAVVYEAMNPERASYRGANPLSHFLGKRKPG